MRKEVNIKTNKKLHPATLSETSLLVHNLYLSILKKFNQMEKLKILEVSKAELLEMMGFDQNKGYSLEHFKEILVKLTEGVQFKFSEKYVINGSIFNVVGEDDIYKIAINYPYSEWIFTSKDLRLMSKAKKNEKMNVDELDYYKNVLETKNSKTEGKGKELMLLVEEEFLNLPSIYSRKLYSLFKKFEGSHLLKISINDFKISLDIPTTYRMCDIDLRVIKQAKEDLKTIGIEFSETKNKDNPKDKRQVTSLTFKWKYKTKSLSEGKEKKELTKSLVENLEEERIIKTDIRKEQYEELYQQDLRDKGVKDIKTMRITFDIVNKKKYNIVDMSNQN